MKVKAEHAGKMGKCPRCQMPIQVPRLADPTSSTAELSLPSQETLPGPTRPVTSKASSQSSANKLIPPVRTSDSSTGRLARRKSPGESTTISAVRRIPTPSPLEKTLADLSIDVRPPNPSMGYRLALLAVAILTVMLPIIYIAMIGVVAWLVYNHAIYNLIPIPVVGVRAAIFAFFFFYIAPLVAGVVVLVVMIRPLLSIPWGRVNGTEVTREQAPLLYQLVERLCEATGAPMPKAIFVSNSANAFAALRSGIWSIPTGHVVLSIGMPLVATTRVDQLAGVIAHEFGHFNQKSAMGLTALVHFVNRWLVRACASSERADDFFNDFRDRYRTGFFEVLMFVMQFFIAIPRGILWLLLLFSCRLCSNLSWQQEYDADHTAARVIGSQRYSKTLRQIVLASTAEGESLRLVAEKWGLSNQLPVNFADLVAVTLERNRERLTSLAKSIFSKKDESVMSTHPPMKDRVNRLKEKEEPGAFECDFPSTELFADFEGMAGKASFAMFHQLVGKRISQAKYVSSHAYFVKHA